MADGASQSSDGNNDQNTTVNGTRGVRITSESRVSFTVGQIIAIVAGAAAVITVLATSIGFMISLNNKIPLIQESVTDLNKKVDGLDDKIDKLRQLDSAHETRLGILESKSQPNVNNQRQ